MDFQRISKLWFKLCVNFREWTFPYNLFDLLFHYTTCDLRDVSFSHCLLITWKTEPWTIYIIYILWKKTQFCFIFSSKGFKDVKIPLGTKAGFTHANFVSRLKISKIKSKNRAKICEQFTDFSKSLYLSEILPEFNWGVSKIGWQSWRV